MLSRLHGLVFVHVPKCAGMSVEAALGGLPRSQRTEQHFRAEDYARYYPDEWATFHKFAVVRHPVQRARSFVRFFRRYDPVWRRHTVGVDDEALLRDLLLSGNLLTQRTCDRMLSGDEEILRFEQLEADWARFAAERGVPTTLPRVNSAPEAPRAPLTPGTVLMIEALFPQDFDRFGYARSGLRVHDLPLEEQGAVMWAQLRAWASDATAQEPETWRAALADWEASIPEPGWQERWADACRVHPLPHDPNELGFWTELVHEHINLALGKRPWSPWSTGD